MGQMMNREAEGKRQESTGGAVKHDLKDRTGANFKANSPMVNNPNASGTGKQGNPGKPT